MGSSIRRKLRRQYWGVTRNASTARWIRVRGTVGVSVDRMANYPPEHMEASEGAERSCLRRRRKRGLRRGRRRSRVGNTRRSAEIRPPIPKPTGTRSLNRLLAQLDFWRSRLDVLFNEIDRYGKEGWTKPMINRRGDLYLAYTPRYIRCSEHWKSLLRGMKRGNKGVLPIYQDTFDFILRKRVGVVMPSVLSEIDDLLSSGIGHLDRPFGSERDQAEHSLMCARIARQYEEPYHCENLVCKKRTLEGKPYPGCEDCISLYRKRCMAHRCKPGSPCVLPGPKGKGKGAARGGASK